MAAKRIIVADDRPDMLAFMRVALEHAGFEVALARNGGEAVALQRRRAADLLITDIFMPDVDGIELIDRFHSAFPATRVIAMSAGAPGMQDYLRVVRHLGVDATLPKPFGTEELLRVVKTVLC